MMEKCRQRRGMEGDGGDGWWWLRDDEETMRHLAHSPLRGGPLLSHFNLWLTSGPPLLRPRLHSAVTQFNGGIQECTGLFWTETPGAIKKKSQFLSLPCFTLESHYTTHAHHRNTCSNTTVQPQIGIPWSCTVLWKLQQGFLLHSLTLWPLDLMWKV